MDKTIVLTAHARARLRDRNIQLAWVEDTVRKPDWVEHQATDRTIERRFRAIPQFNGRILRAACTEQIQAFVL